MGLASARPARSVRKGARCWRMRRASSVLGGLAEPAEPGRWAGDDSSPPGAASTCLPPPSPATAAVVAAAACRSSSFDKEPPTQRPFRFLRKNWRSSHQTRNYTLWCVQYLRDQLQEVPSKLCVSPWQQDTQQKTERPKTFTAPPPLT